jgi:hypothetical protein
MIAAHAHREVGMTGNHADNRSLVMTDTLKGRAHGYSQRDILRDFNAALCYFGGDPTHKAMLAAWWFIENVDDQHEPARTELFFKVRELVREAGAQHAGRALQRKRGRPSVGDKPMTSTERARLFRQRNPDYNKRPPNG